MDLFLDIIHPYYGKFRVIKNDLGISQWIIKDYIWEQHILELICNYIKPDTTVIDIGANIGTHTVGIIKHLNQYNNKSTKIVAFEPQPFIFDILQKNITNVNTTSNIACELHSYGLSNKSQTIYMSMPDYSIVENPGGYGIDFNDIPDISKTKVEIKTLDSFHYTNVSFIKIDVEGHENEVLNGAIDTIQNSRPVMIIEILGGVSLENATESQLIYINKTKDLISSMNYRVTLISCCDYLCIPL
jgi:FkbM family methyltransferase